MSAGLFVSASGMLAEDARADVIANNLANVRTAGFRKDFVSFRQRFLGARDRANARGSAAPGLVLDRTAWDREPGPVETTGRALDFAIRGDGWFRIQREGKTFYTRAGDFIVDSGGTLRTSDGKGEVMASSGEPVNLAGVQRFEVNERGDITTPDGVIATLAVVDFDRPGALAKAGEALFLDPGTAGAHAAAGAEIYQGGLEQSSVEPVREMVAMIAAFRSYEMNAQVLKMQDEMLGRAANDVGRLQA